MYRPLREARYQDLLSLGMMPFEARILSKVPRHVPYLRELVATRYVEYQKAKRKGVSDAAFQTHIVRRYNMKGWRRGFVKSENSVWAMFKSKEYAFKAAHPEYKSEWQKKSHHKDSDRAKSKLDAALSNPNISTTQKRIILLKDSLQNFPPQSDRYKELKNQIDELENEGHL